MPRKTLLDKLLKMIDFHCGKAPSYNVGTTAGASSMTIDSAATLVDCLTQLICTWICMDSPPPAVFHDMTKFLDLPTEQYVS